VTAVTGDGDALDSDALDSAVEEAMLLPLPRIPVSAGALIFDRAGGLLILKPTYKSGWTIPGGVMEADGESPWEACQREVREETGIEVSRGRLAAMDFRRPRPGRPGGIRFLFDCGKMSGKALARLTLQPEEISEARFVRLPEALDLLRGPIRRRVRAATSGRRLVYLEDGRPVLSGVLPVTDPHGAAAADPAWSCSPLCPFMPQLAVETFRRRS